MNKTDNTHTIDVKKIALLHDMAGFGRCSLSVILPTLSAMGHQCVAMPTALLSTHTGGFEGFTFLDLTAQLRGAAEHYRMLDIAFDAIYSGFLGSEEQIAVVADFISAFKKPGTLVVVDPVMADDGVMYSTYTPRMRCGMQELCHMADIITPNVTEAYFLLEQPYRQPPQGTEECERLITALRNRYGCEVVITGAEIKPGSVSTLSLEKQALNVCDRPRVPASYPGTGDIFCSVLTGALLNGNNLGESVELAADFVWRAADLTWSARTPVREGVCYEKLLGWLANHIVE